MDGGLQQDYFQWSHTMKGPNIRIAGGQIAINKVGPFDSPGHSVCSSLPLNAGRHFVELVFEIDGVSKGDQLAIQPWHWVGVLSSEYKDALRTILRHKDGLGGVQGFWGVDSYGGAGRMCGIRMGAGGTAAAPEESRTVADRGYNWVFACGDRVGLVVDMNARTLVIYRDGKPIPGLTFTGLPEEVYVCATPFYPNARVSIEQGSLEFRRAVTLHRHWAVVRLLFVGNRVRDGVYINPGSLFRLLPGDVVGVCSNALLDSFALMESR